MSLFLPQIIHAMSEATLKKKLAERRGASSSHENSPTHLFDDTPANAHFDRRTRMGSARNMANKVCYFANVAILAFFH